MFQKGNTIRLGIKHSKEAKKKMSENTKGHFVSEETRKKMSLAHRGCIAWNKGIPCSEEGKLKRSKVLKGRTSPMKGRKQSKEAKEKMRQAMIGKFVSEETRQKRSKSLKGNKNPMWIDGRTPENHRIRNGIEIRLWREAVFARDNWTCQKTGIIGGRLRAHHIHNFADYPELRTSIENGITLSDKAHREFHKIYGRKNNTKEQMNEFLETSLID